MREEGTKHSKTTIGKTRAHTHTHKSVNSWNKTETFKLTSSLSHTLSFSLLFTSGWRKNGKKMQRSENNEQDPSYLFLYFELYKCRRDKRERGQR